MMIMMMQMKNRKNCNSDKNEAHVCSEIRFNERSVTER